jgi:hypothetical protein
MKRYKLVTVLFLAVVVVLLHAWYNDKPSPNFPFGEFSTPAVLFLVTVLLLACVVLTILGRRKPKESDSRSGAGREGSSLDNANLPSGRSAL